MKNKTCNCDFCKRDRQWDRFLKKYNFTKKDKEFLEKIYSDLCNTEFDHDVQGAVLDGSWPSSIEVLTRSLKLAKDIKKRRDAGERI